MREYPRINAVVLTSAGVHYDNGVTRPLPPGLELDNIAAVLAGAARAFNSGEGVCMVDIDLKTAGTVLENTELEWHYTKLRPWTTFVRGTDGAVVHLGLLGELVDNPQARVGPLLDGVQNQPEQIAWRLGRYATATGSPWRATAGISGCAAIRAQYNDPRPGRQPLWRHQTIKGLRSTGPLIWRSPEQPEQGADGYVHVFDVNAMYLAGLRNSLLAWGALERNPTATFDPSWPGYWEVDITGLPAELYDGKTRPPVFPASFVHRGAAWLSTPVVKYLCEWPGWAPTVLDAYVCENGHPIGRAYAERLMAARRGEYGSTDGIMLAIKRTYAELIGMMARGGGSIERPDWAGHVMDLSRVNMLRRLRKIVGLNARILAVQTDAAYILTDDPRDQTVGPAIGIGKGPGLFRYQDALTVAQYRAKMIDRK